MALFEWSDELYGTGIEEIDSQHQRMIAMANELHSAMTKLESETTCGKLLADLVGYTAHHFETEEKLMEQAGYPRLEDHKLEHQELNRQLNEFHLGYKSGRKLLSVELVEFLSSWLIEHTEGSDRKIGRFISGAEAQ